jgi:hypothetical protein
MKEDRNAKPKSQTVGVARVLRAVGGLLAVLLVVGVVGFSTPERAAAHDVAHECNGRTSSGFSCSTRRHSSLNRRYVTTYYNGTVRSESSIDFYFTPSGQRRIRNVVVCDRMNDGNAPHIRIKKSNSSYRTFRDTVPGSGCGVYRDINMPAINAWRVFMKSGGDVNHGSYYHAF